MSRAGGRIWAVGLSQEASTDFLDLYGTSLGGIGRGDVRRNLRVLVAEAIEQLREAFQQG